MYFVYDYHNEYIIFVKLCNRGKDRSAVFTSWTDQHKPNHTISSLRADYRQAENLTSWLWVLVFDPTLYRRRSVSATSSERSRHWAGHLSLHPASVAMPTSPSNQIVIMQSEQGGGRRCRPTDGHLFLSLSAPVWGEGGAQAATTNSTWQQKTA